MWLTSLVVLGRYELCLYWELHLALRSMVHSWFPEHVLQVMACRCGGKTSWGIHMKT